VFFGLSVALALFMLGLPFPGGPNIERAAQMGNATAFDFPRPRPDGTYDQTYVRLDALVQRPD
jgi:N6-L-threonylcarbamoyladenine synthase